MIKKDLHNILDAICNLADQFFEHLINGRLEKAKLARTNLGNALGSYKNLLTKYRDSLQTSTDYEVLMKTSTVSYETLIELDSKINQCIADLTEEAFQSDFKTWQDLLRAEFYEIITKLKKTASDGKKGLGQITSVVAKRFLPAERVIKTQDYDSACDKYSAWLNQIREKENLIEYSSEYVPNLHEIWQTGKWANHRHARLSGNLRIMYFYDSETKTLTYKDILTKNELDKS